MMPNFISQLPQRTHAQQRHSNLIGYGKQAIFNTQRGHLRMALYPLNDLSPSLKVAEYHTDLGTLSLEVEQAEHWLNQLSNAPYPSTLNLDQSCWEVQWYQQQIHQELIPLFYPLTRMMIEDNHTLERHWYRLHWQQGDSRASLTIGLTDDTLSEWLRRHTWQSIATLDTGSLLLTTPLIVGSLAFDQKALKQLSIGDVLHCTQPRFSCEGMGALQLGSTLFTLQANFDGTVCHYLVTQRTSILQTESSMNHSEDWSYESNLPPEESHSLSAGDTLPITLTIHAGDVTLSLEELSQLTVGSLLTAKGVAPGHAELRQGQRRIASGELVSIEGELGLQLTDIYLPTRRLTSSPELNEEFDSRTAETESDSWD